MYLHLIFVQHLDGGNRCYLSTTSDGAELIFMCARNMSALRIAVSNLARDIALFAQQGRMLDQRPISRCVRSYRQPGLLHPVLTTKQGG